MWGALEQETHPVLPSHAGTGGMCSWLLQGTGGTAASPPTEMFAGGTLSSRKWEMLLVSTIWMGLGTLGTGVLYADEEIQKGF